MRLGKKLILFITSCIGGVLLWFYVMSSQSLTIDKVMYLRFNLPKDLAISSPKVDQVKYELSGPAIFLRGLKAQKHSINLNLRPKKKNGDQVNINLSDVVVDLPIGVSVTSITPEKISFKLEKKYSKTIPVIVANNKDYSNYFFEIKPTTIQILGVQSLLDELKDYRLEIPDDLILADGLMKTLPITLDDPRLRSRQRFVDVTIRSKREHFTPVTVKIELSNEIELAMQEHQYAVVYIDPNIDQNLLKQLKVKVDVKQDIKDEQKVQLKVYPEDISPYVEWVEPSIMTLRVK